MINPSPNSSSVKDHFVKLLTGEESPSTFGEWVRTSPQELATYAGGDLCTTLLETDYNTPGSVLRLRLALRSWIREHDPDLHGCLVAREAAKTAANTAMNQQTTSSGGSFAGKTEVIWLLARIFHKKAQTSCKSLIE